MHGVKKNKRSQNISNSKSFAVWGYGGPCGNHRCSGARMLAQIHSWESPIYNDVRLHRAFSRNLTKPRTGPVCKACQENGRIPHRHASDNFGVWLFDMHRRQMAAHNDLPLCPVLKMRRGWRPSACINHSLAHGPPPYLLMPYCIETSILRSWSSSSLASPRFTLPPLRAFPLPLSEDLPSLEQDFVSSTPTLSVKPSSTSSEGDSNENMNLITSVELNRLLLHEDTLPRLLLSEPSPMPMPTD